MRALAWVYWAWLALRYIVTGRPILEEDREPWE